MRSIATAAGRISGLLVFFLLLAGFASGQQKTVTGVVKSSEDGTPVVKATVQVKGTNSYVTTDTKGFYTIRAAANQTIVVTAVGYQSQEKSIGSQSVINFQLASSAGQMEDVVVTALGIRREEKALGYSTTTVKGEQLTDAVASNWTDALSGKVAGLNLIRSGSGPTGSNKIILRGENNLSADRAA